MNGLTDFFNPTSSWQNIGKREMQIDLLKNNKNVSDWFSQCNNLCTFLRVLLHAEKLTLFTPAPLFDRIGRNGLFSRVSMRITEEQKGG
ncbi:MAG: hypothetical protein K1X82_14960 [Bacteroidia bacterium]|nr:hypothetical protein [Bacteroidia bacterium]